MTFTEIVAAVQDRLNLRSADAAARIGREVNARYKRVLSSLGLQVAKRVTGVPATASLGLATLTFDDIEKIERVYDSSSGANRFLEEVTFEVLRTENPGTSDTPTRYAVQNIGPGFVTIRVNVLAQTAFTLYADGRERAETLSGSLEPQFSESFHDLLEEGVMADELRKQEKLALAKAAEETFEKRLGELRFDIIKSSMTLRQGGAQRTTTSAINGASGGGSAPSGGTSWEQTGLINFNRGSSAPFAVNSGAAVVPNLDADKLDGLDVAGVVALAGDVDGPASSTDHAIVRFDGMTGKVVQDSGATISDAGALTATNFSGTHSGTSSGTNTGDVTLAGSPNYLTLVGQVITRALIDLTSHITGRLPFANLVAATAASRLLGRGSASGAGNFEELTVGAGLSLSGTALSALITTGVRQITTAAGATNFSTSSTSNVDVTGMSVTLTTGASASVIVFASVPCSVAGGNSALFDWNIDGADTGSTQGVETSATSTMTTLFRVVTGLSAGAHTIKLRVRSSGGSAVTINMSGVMVGNIFAFEYR